MAGTDKGDVVEERGTAPELPVELSRQFGVEVHAEPAAPDGVPDVPQDDAPLEGSAEIEGMGADEDVESVISEDKLERIKESKRKTGRLAAPFKWLLAIWKGHAWLRRTVIVVLMALIVAAAAWPISRYAVLNVAGIRGSASVAVVDELTRMPLKNVTVRLGDRTERTDIDGKARFSKLTLGRRLLSVRRLAFAPYEQPVTIGWGSNPLGPFVLHATGVRYTVRVVDFLSGKPIKAADVDSDETGALANKDGQATLAIAGREVTKLTATVSAEGYRPESVDLDISTDGSPTIRLVPSGKTVFVNPRDGTFDVVAMDIDGKNSEVLVPGSGSELADIGLVVKPDGRWAALVSTRDDVRDADGYRLRSLTLINVAEKTFSVVDRAEQIQLIDWIGDRLVYRSTVAGASAANPQRNKLISYHTGTSTRLQLATANQFNTVISARGLIYYAMSSTDPEAILGLFVVKPDGSGKTRLSNEEIWTGLRWSYNTFNLQTPAAWMAFDVASRRFTPLTVPPRIVTYAFVDEPGESPANSAWMDTTDGRKTLKLYDIAKKTSRDLTSQDGMAAPVRWIGHKVIVYRVATSAETADYALSPDGGAPYRIGAVAPSFGYSLPF